MSNNASNSISFKGFERVLIRKTDLQKPDVLNNVLMPYLKKKTSDEPTMAFVGSGFTCAGLIQLLPDISKISRRSTNWLFENMKYHKVEIPPEITMEGEFPIHMVYGTKDVDAYLKFEKRQQFVRNILSKFYDMFCPKDIPYENRLIYGEIKAYSSIRNAFEKFLKKHNVVDVDLQKIRADFNSGKF